MVGVRLVRAARPPPASRLLPLSALPIKEMLVSPSKHTGSQNTPPFLTFWWNMGTGTPRAGSAAAAAAMAAWLSRRRLRGSGARGSRLRSGGRVPRTGTRFCERGILLNYHA